MARDPDPGRKGVCYVTDAATTAGRPLLQIIGAAIDGGADMVQIRDRNLGADELLKLARTAVDLARRSGARCRIIVNDRLDVAMAAKAAGVHLPADGLPPKEVRARASGLFRIGRSTHSVAEGRDAARAGVDYLFFGPVFETPGKAGFGPPQGVATLRRFVSSVRRPVWAIGGITPATAQELREVSIAGVAAIRAIGEAADPAAAIGALRAALAPPES